jgi:hypothetical protein
MRSARGAALAVPLRNRLPFNSGQPHTANAGDPIVDEIVGDGQSTPIDPRPCRDPDIVIGDVAAAAPLCQAAVARRRLAAPR